MNTGQDIGHQTEHCKLCPCFDVSHTGVTRTMDKLLIKYIISTIMCTRMINNGLPASQNGCTHELFKLLSILNCIVIFYIQKLSSQFVFVLFHDPIWAKQNHNLLLNCIAIFYIKHLSYQSIFLYICFTTLSRQHKIHIRYSHHASDGNERSKM